MVAPLLFLEMPQSIAISQTIRVCRAELSTGRDVPHYGQLDRHSSTNLPRKETPKRETRVTWLTVIVPCSWSPIDFLIDWQTLITGPIWTRPDLTLAT